jgi:hypothetical protein
LLIRSEGLCRCVDATPKSKIRSARPKTAAILEFGARCDPHQRCDLRQPKLAREATIAVEPVDLASHRDGSLLNAPCPLSTSVTLSSAAAGALAKKLSISARKVGWLSFTASR